MAIGNISNGESGASSRNKINQTINEVNGLTDGSDNTEHYHSTDRDRSNHTGTQESSTISDLSSTISSNSTVVANTAKVSFPEAPSDGNQYARKDAGWEQVEATGSGDVVGPGIAVDTNIAVYSGTTGKLIADGGTAIAALATTLALNAHTNDATIHFVKDPNWDTAYSWGDHAGLYANISHNHTASEITDFDTEVSNNTSVMANTAKVSNATHTGQITGSTALTLDKTSITDQSVVTAVSSDYVVISDTSDTGNLKKALISDFASAGGDMDKATYDPTNVADDVFDMDNMAEGVTSKILTSTERTNITNNTAKVTNATHTGDMDGNTALTANSALITGKATVTADDADYVLISDTSDSGNLKKALKSDFGGGGGTGDVTGPAGAVAGNMSKFADSTGKVISDSGISDTEVQSAYDHVGDTGASHTYIDQDLTTSGAVQHLSLTANSVSASNVYATNELYGSVNPGENLNIYSTSNATKGRVISYDPIDLPNPSDYRIDNGSVLNKTTLGSTVVNSSLTNVGTLANLAVNGYIDMTGIIAPGHLEGRFFYSSTDKCLVYYNNDSNVAHQVGRELWTNCCNNTGVTIPDATIVYVSGVDTGCPEISLAQPDEFDKSRIIGVTTTDIANGSSGEVTGFGLVGGFDSGALTPGTIYLTTDGAKTNTPPSGTMFTVTVGTLLVASATDALLYVKSSVSDTTVEVVDTNGFPNTTDTTMSLTDGTRTFAIAPTGTKFYFYQSGQVYKKTSSESIQIPDEEGKYLFTYNLGTLEYTKSPTDGDVSTSIRTKCLVAYTYWDETNSTFLYLQDERHGISMAPSTHASFHFGLGALYQGGLGIGDVISEANGDLDTHAQFSISNGAMSDDDFYHVITGFASTVGTGIFYLLGATPNTRRVTQTGFSVYSTGSPNGRLWYNENIGGTWQLTEVSNNDYVLYHMFTMNGYTGTEQIVSIMGQAKYSSAALARAGAGTEIQSLIATFSFEELVPIATFIFQTSNIYGNAVQARIRVTDTGEDYINWTTSEIVGGAAVSNHNNLGGLQGVGSGVTWGHLDDQAQTVYGIKTFDSFAITPSSLPTSSYQISNKIYTDSKMFLYGDWDGNSVSQNGVVTDSGYTGVVLSASTTDRPAPQPNGDVEPTVPDSVSWTESSNTSVVRAIHDITFTKDVEASVLQVIVPEWDTDFISRIYVINNTNSTYRTYTNKILNSGTYTTLSTEKSIIESSDSYTVAMDTYNASDTQGVDGGWTLNVGVGAPASAEFNVNSITVPTDITISHTDLDAGNRGTELDGVAVDSIMFISETLRPERYIEVKVTVSTAQTGYTDYDVTLISKSNQNISNGAICTLNIDTPVIQPTKYYRAAALYATQPSYCTITTALEYDGVDQGATNTDAYGINVIAQPVKFSSNFKIISSPSGSSGGSGGSGDVVGPAVAVSGNLASYDGTTGKIIADSAVPSSYIDQSVTTTANVIHSTGRFGGTPVETVSADADDLIVSGDGTSIGMSFVGTDAMLRFENGAQANSAYIYNGENDENLIVYGWGSALTVKNSGLYSSNDFNVTGDISVTGTVDGVDIANNVVTKSGTPVNNQIGVWTSATKQEGTSSLTFDTTGFKLGLGYRIVTGGQSSSDTASGGLTTYHSGGASNASISMTSSTMASGLTQIGNTRRFGSLGIHGINDGGVRLTGITDDSSPGTVGICLSPYTRSIYTSTGTSMEGQADVNCHMHNGSNTVSSSSGSGNMFTVRNNGSARFGVYGGGDIWNYGDILTQGGINTGGETSPDTGQGGLCIKSTSSAANLFTIKLNSTHGLTGFAETDTFYEHTVSSGFGNRITSIKDDFSGSSAYEVIAAALTGVNTGNTDEGLFNFAAYIHDGANGTSDLTDNENLATFSNRADTIVTIKGDGRILTPGAADGNFGGGTRTEMQALIGMWAGARFWCTTDSMEYKYDGNFWIVPGIVVKKYNNSGITLAEGDVVCYDTSVTNGITTTTLSSDKSVYGVVVEGNTNGQSLTVARSGSFKVNSDGSTNLGDTFRTSNTATEATPSSSNNAGAFATAIDSTGAAGLVLCDIRAVELI